MVVGSSSYTKADRAALVRRRIKPAFTIPSGINLVIRYCNLSSSRDIGRSYSRLDKISGF